MDADLRIEALTHSLELLTEIYRAAEASEDQHYCELLDLLLSAHDNLGRLAKLAAVNESRIDAMERWLCGPERDDF